MSRTRDAEDLAKFLRKNVLTENKNTLRRQSNEPSLLHSTNTSLPLDFAPTEHRLRHPLLYSLADRRCFGSTSFLSGRESRIAKRKTTDEKAVEGPVKTIMDELKKAKEVQSAVDLVNGLVFENHPHALSDAAAKICVCRIEDDDDSSSSSMLYIPEYKSLRQLPAHHLLNFLRTTCAPPVLDEHTRGSGRPEDNININ
ncbi:hypothetical protein CTAM01_17111 [Colletotrichum tamarilloi]|uniref:Uncharacterized protein n=1 Tax=Colletotrichum tamarilloi TaxID=1209934 RepID=A0ABQ9QGN2_9PEZI|nr:uncharacterized protein CTAM01_17111 [Colletotrichum tamarilloi]KAK1462015.1 hypothetical protein CTAM01_17111 [Colletotrichum tamarilloi]